MLSLALAVILLSGKLACVHRQDTEGGDANLHPWSVFTSGSLCDHMSSSLLRRLRQLAMRIEHELRCSTLIETLISLCRIFE